MCSGVFWGSFYFLPLNRGFGGKGEHPTICKYTPVWVLRGSPELVLPLMSGTKETSCTFRDLVCLMLPLDRHSRVTGECPGCPTGIRNKCPKNSKSCLLCSPMSSSRGWWTGRSPNSRGTVLCLFGDLSYITVVYFLLWCILLTLANM